MNARDRDRLTALDAAFLFIERPGLPIHIASVGTLEAGPLLHADGTLRLDEIRAQVVTRLDDLPRFRRRIAWPRIPGVRPRWVDDAGFDVTEHVDAIDLPAADTDALRHYAEHLIAEPLPDDRPRWQLRFVTGLTDDRIGLIERVHHALADGVSGVDVTTVLFDLTREPVESHPSTWAPLPRTSPVTDLLVDALAPVRTLSGTVPALAHPAAVVRRAAAVARSAATVVADGVLAPRSGLNQPVGPTRHLSWIRADLDEVKEAGHRRGGTTNDVVLAAVAHGLRTLLLGRGETVMPGDVLKVLVPVSRRRDQQHGALGNRLGALFVPLPIGIGDPQVRLDAVIRTSAERKERDEMSTTELLLSAADLLPTDVVARLARLTDHQPFVNLVITNVPGPPVPIYCRGARLLEAFPVVPLGGNLTIGVAVLSYDGALNLGVTADAEHVPDLDVLTSGIEAGLAALRSGPVPS